MARRVRLRGSRKSVDEVDRVDKVDKVDKAHRSVALTPWSGFTLRPDDSP